MNNVTIAGNLTRDPEMRYTPTGKAVTEFTVAVNEGTGDKRVTHFIRCVAWEKTAEIVAEQARKGTKIVIDGSLAVDTWNDKETGKRREITKVRARSAYVISPSTKQEAPKNEEDFEDIPF